MNYPQPQILTEANKIEVATYISVPQYKFETINVPGRRKFTDFEDHLSSPGSNLGFNFFDGSGFTNDSFDDGVEGDEFTDDFEGSDNAFKKEGGILQRMRDRQAIRQQAKINARLARAQHRQMRNSQPPDNI